MLENVGSLSAVTVLIIGFTLGLKHATEVDHVVAISTIVSQHKNVFRSAIVGALWAQVTPLRCWSLERFALLLRVAIPERVSGWLEFGVALMIIGLGISALWRALRKGTQIHVHEHSHDGLKHKHIHFHDHEKKHEPSATSRHSHAVARVGFKPLLIGTMHGLAGSGALTLLVLTQISSSWIALLYLAIFGIGSIAGMVLMSGLLGLPFALTSRNLTKLHYQLQTVAAALSICFGIWYAYHTGTNLLF
jgi:ABC-type nickel/cobalt efflux system permease component RcnA